MRVKLFVALLLGAVLTVGARAQTATNQPPNIPPQTVAAGMLEALLYGAEGEIGLAQFVALLERQTDPSPLLEQRALLADLRNQAPAVYTPAIRALINACDTALQLYTFLQDETLALRTAIPRYYAALNALNGFPPTNAVEAARLRELETAALVAQQFYARAANLRATAIQYCQDGAAAKVTADQMLNNP